MDTQELIRKVRKIEIKTRGLSSQLFAGEYQSSFKGRGMSFSEVREYQYGDDVRSIDWNVSARLNHPYIKVFEEERELTLLLMADISKSAFFGASRAQKETLMTELCAVLSFSAMLNNDKVGIIFFSDHVEQYIPPQKGRSHILRIIRELVDFKPNGKGTDIEAALEYMMNVQKKRAIVFLLSDFFDRHYEKPLKYASRRHDMVGIRLYDDREIILPKAGLLPVIDLETGRQKWINTSSKTFRQHYSNAFEKNKQYFEKVFLKSGADQISIATKDSYVKALIGFFQQRSKRR